MDIHSLLETLGLSGHEVKIYLAILEKGTASIADITRHTGLHRPTVYQFLPALMEKNLVSLAVVGKKKIYSAESPVRLQRMLDQMTVEFNRLLPELVSAYDNRRVRPRITFYEGKKMVTWVYDDLLASCKKGDIFYRYESPKNYVTNDVDLPAAYFKRICERKEIQKFVITNEKTAKSKPQVMERVSRFVPAAYDWFEYDITQIVYANKVAFLDFNTKTAWIIENATFAKFQRQLFKLLFGKL